MILNDKQNCNVGNAQAMYHIFFLVSFAFSVFLRRCYMPRAKCRTGFARLEREHDHLAACGGDCSHQSEIDQRGLPKERKYMFNAFAKAQDFIKRKKLPHT